MPTQAVLAENATNGQRSGRRSTGRTGPVFIPLLVLLLLTFGALLVHGYHPWAEDAEIYLPGVEKMLHPELFPYNAQFFEAHAQHTFFPNLIAASVRITHLPLAWALFLWQIAAVFLFLLACWELAAKCSASPPGQWAGVALVASLLTIPISGTALYILDQYTNPRNLVAFAAVFTIIKVLDRKYFQAALFLAFAAAIHPLMSAFVLSYCILLVVMERVIFRSSAWLLLFPFGLSFERPSLAYHEAALTHAYHYVTNWQWYEWLGVVGPLILLWLYARIARAKQAPQMNLMCRALIVCQVMFVIAALVLDIPERFEALARLQPMRSLYLCYVLFILFSGVLIGQYILKKHIWRWLLLFVPLCAGMFMAQRELFPASAHVEWPWAAAKNPWEQAFLWVRGNTPKDAVFALSPTFMNIPGEDENGFRDIAERSRLADDVKDNGAVSMFPALAGEWASQVHALRGWRNFGARDFLRLHKQFGVNWVVLQRPAVAGLDCPYQNQAVSVCKVTPD